MRIPRFVAAAALCIGVTLSLTGCGGHSRHARTVGGELSIYTSLPFEGPYASQAQAIYEGEELALAQTGGVVGGFKVVLRRLDDAGSSAGSNPTLVDENARIAAGDPSTIAYLGDLTPGSSVGSIRILSRAGILQVSPGDTATGLSGKTFARVIPPDSDQALAELEAMGRLGVRTLYVVADRTRYGRDIATAVLGDAASYGIVVVDPHGRYLPGDTRSLVRAIKKSKAGAVLYAGSPSPAVAPFWNALAAADGAIRKFASAAVTYTPGWSQTTAAARSNTYLSTPGLVPSRLPRAGSQFETDFVATYAGRSAWANAIFGYVAMSGVLEALHSLGERPKDARAKIVSAFLRFRDLPSALGTYSIVGGQSTFQAYYFTVYSRSGLAQAFIPGVA